MSYSRRLSPSASIWGGLLLLAVSFGIAPFVLAIEPQNVLVLYNADDPNGAGFQIADYYQREAHPGVHLVGLTGINDILSGPYGEEVSGADYLNVIRPQVLSAIGSISESIEVIVTTKGLPLRIDAGTKPPNTPQILVWKRYASLESELTRIDAIDTTNEMGDQYIFLGLPQFDNGRADNPYYNHNLTDDPDPFVRAGSDPINGDMRLAARLDGYSVETVHRMIDDAQNAYVVPWHHYVVADDDPNPAQASRWDQIINRTTPGTGDGSGPGPGLIPLLQLRGQAFVSDYDQPEATQQDPITTAPGPVIGYVSHGTNDGPGGLETGYIGGQLNFSLAKGAVFFTHESYNGISFDPNYLQDPNATGANQGQLAQWLEIGGTAALGQVTEPASGPDNVLNEDLFYNAMLPDAGALPGESGLTLVESAWNATRQLSYMNTVIGDPLMRWRKWVPGDTNFDGAVEFNDFYTMQGNWWQSGGIADGDFNGDNTIDSEDFDILRSYWLTEAGLATLGSSEILVLPELDPNTGVPYLDATLLNPANFDGDLDVDSDDLEILWASYGVDDGGDLNDDGETSGTDFLEWQRQFQLYTLTSDFNYNGMADAGDGEIWENSYGTNLGGDADRDGDTDGVDFLLWQIERANGLAIPPPESMTVPEPSTAVLIALIAMAPHRFGRFRLRLQGASAR